MVVDQVKWFQEHGADVTIAVADLESVATRGIDANRQANRLEEYVASYAALGLNPERTSVYFQSRRFVVQRLGFTLGMRTNLSELEAIYGFDGCTNLAHVQAPLVQAGDILHPQLEEHGGLRPIVVPVGTDRDPHLRLLRSSSKDLVVQPHGAEAGRDADRPLGSRQQRPPWGLGRTVASIGPDVVGHRCGPRDAMTDTPDSLTRCRTRNMARCTSSATGADRWRMGPRLLHLERHLGGRWAHASIIDLSPIRRRARWWEDELIESEEHALFLTDDATTIERKIKRAFSGGQPTVEEHRRLGGDVDRDVPFQYLSYFFEEDDRALADLAEAYRNGRLLAGEMKQVCIEAAHAWFQDHQEHRDQTAHLIPEFLAEDSR